MSATKLSFKEAVQKIRDLFGLADMPAAGDTQPADALKVYSLDDGTSVWIDKLEAGGKVYTDTAMTPAPAGDLALADGTVVTVGDGGAITNVTVPAPADGDTPEMTAMRALAAKFATGTPDERLGNLETMTKALMQYNFGWKISEAEQKVLQDQAIAIYKTTTASQLQMQAQQFSDQLTKERTDRLASEQKYKEAIGQLLTVVEQFAAEPAADPVQVPAGSSAQQPASQTLTANLAKTFKANREQKA